MKFVFIIIVLFFVFSTKMFCLVSSEISDSQLAYMYNHPKTTSYYKQMIEQYIYQKRMAKCLRHFGSRLVCENNTTWFMWAQLLARDIMNGKY